jgi:hypothetical protein
MAPMMPNPRSFASTYEPSSFNMSRGTCNGCSRAPTGRAGRAYPREWRVTSAHGTRCIQIPSSATAGHHRPAAREHGTAAPSRLSCDTDVATLVLVVYRLTGHLHHLHHSSSRVIGCAQAGHCSGVSGARRAGRGALELRADGVARRGAAGGREPGTRMKQCGQCSGPASKLLRHRLQVIVVTATG